MIARCLRAWPFAAACLLLFFHPARAQRVGPLCQTGCFTYSVSVTPDNAPGGTVVNFTGGYGATFAVKNTGNTADTYNVSCSGANLTCTGTSLAQVSLGAGATAEVDAYFTAGSAGSATLTLTAASTNDSHNSQDNGSFIYTVAPSVSVTPDAGAVSVPSHSAPSQPFTIHNNLSTTTTFTLTPSCTGAAACAGTPTSLPIGPGADASASVTYTVGWGGRTGVVKLKAAVSTDTTQKDTAWVNVTTVPASPSVARGLCLTIAAGAGAAYECGDLRLAHGLPGVRTLNKARAPVLLYNSQHAHPHPLVTSDVTIPTGQAVPDSLVATLMIGQTQYDRRAWAGSQWGAAGQTRRIAAGFDAVSLSTGLYAYALTIQQRTGGSFTLLKTDSGAVPIVNRSAGGFGAGWWLAGYEQLFFASDTTVFWVGGDGSTRRYESTGRLRGADTVYLAPPLVHPDTLLHTSLGKWVRLVPGGAKVTFSASGRDSLTTNRLGYSTQFTDSAGLLVRITMPGDTTLKYTFAYSGSPATLGSVSVPDSAIGVNRVTTLTWVGDSLKIADPASAPVVFAYDPAQTKRILARRDRRGAVWSYQYDAGSRLASASLGNPSITETFCAAEVRGLAACSPTLVAPESAYAIFDGPRTDSVDVMNFWTGPFGVTKIRDPYGNITSVDRTDTRWPALPTHVQYPNGRTLGATYDARGNLATSTDTSLYTAGVHATTQYQWDQTWDEVTQVTLPTGEFTQFSYDATNGNRLWQQDARGTSSRVNFAYYASGNGVGLLKTVTDALGNKDSVAYDARGNHSFSSTPLGWQTFFDNDRLGRTTIVRTQLESGLWRQDSTFYDVGDRVIRTMAYGPPRGGAGAMSLNVRNFYNAESELDSLQRWSVPDTATLVGTITTRWTYDLAGRKITETAPDFAVEYTGYDAAGNPTTVLTRRGHAIGMAYDRLNRLRRRIVPSVTYATFRGKGIAAWGIRGCYIPYPRYAADTGPDQCLGNPQDSIVIPGDLALFSYDVMGNLITADNADAQIRRSYFNDGRVKTDTSKIRTILGTDSTQHVYGLSYRYDLAGRRVVIKHPHQLAPLVGTSVADSTSYTYNSLTGALETVTDPLGDVFTFTYDLRNQRIRLDLPGGISERFGYDPDGRLLGDTVLNNSASPYKNPDATLRLARIHYLDAGTVDSAMNAVGWKDSSFDTYDGLGHLVQFASAAPGGTNFPLGTRFYSTETSSFDALGNAYHSTHSSNVKTTGSKEENFGDRYTRFAPLAGGAPTGRLRASTDATRFDSTWYDPAGNTLFTYQTSSTTTAALEDRASWYGADGKLRMAEHRTMTLPDNDAEPWTISSEQYRYDALGRRVLVRTRSDCNAAGFGGPVTWCSLGTVRRTVWDGQAELYEIQMLGNEGFDQGPLATAEYDTAHWAPVTTNYPTVWDGDRLFGRVAYTYGTSLDQPLSIVRIEYGDTVWNGPFHWWPAFAIIPHYNWRGEPDYGTLGDGGIKTCWPGDASRCVAPRWQPKLFALARQFGDTMTWQWHGTLLEGKEDGAGLQYHRNRYVDPATGRFTQEDPIGVAGGINVYGFANGDPVSYGDAFGLCPPCGLDNGFLAAQVAILNVAVQQTLLGALNAATQGPLVVGASADLGNVSCGFHNGDHGDPCGAVVGPPSIGGSIDVGVRYRDAKVGEIDVSATSGPSKHTGVTISNTTVLVNFGFGTPTTPVTFTVPIPQVSSGGARGPTQAQPDATAVKVKVPKHSKSEIPSIGPVSPDD